MLKLCIMVYQHHKKIKLKARRPHPSGQTVNQAVSYAAGSNQRGCDFEGMERSSDAEKS